jgi:ribosome-associated toxin RatA of RatAB toxin-antitoxin module
MYALVTDVARYPEFLPWCDHASRAGAGRRRHGGRGRHCFQRYPADLHHAQRPHVPGRVVHMQLLKGPFSRLDGAWHFMPLGDGASAPAAWN